MAQLQTDDGRPVASDAMQRDGTPILLLDLSGAKVRQDAVRVREPLRLAAAAEALTKRTGRQVMPAEYVYFHNSLERGISITIPLVALQLRSGTVYLNAEAEMFAAEDDPVMAEVPGADRRLLIRDRISSF